jgi:hypothetical protein
MFLRNVYEIPLENMASHSRRHEVLLKLEAYEDRNVRKHSARDIAATAKETSTSETLHMLYIILTSIPRSPN